MRIKNNRGFTLVEITVSTGIFMFLVACSYTALIAGSTSYKVQVANARAQQQTRGVLDVIKRDLRVAESVLITQDSTVVSVTFSKPDEGNVTYSWTSVGEIAVNQLIRSTSSATRILATDISVLSFNDTGNGIIVDVTSSVDEAQVKDAEFRLVSKIVTR